MKNQRLSPPTTPKMVLRWQREQRGWSQTYVAREVGTDARTVSRWERGVTHPSLYFRQQLCQLFAMDAVALGFVLPESQVGAIHLPQSGLPRSSEPIFDPGRPRLPADMSTYIGRDVLIATCVQTLTKRIPCVLTGLPGIGKTTLAQLVVEQELAKQHFRDGLLWVNLGPTPQIEHELRRLAHLLQVSEDQQQQARSIEAWSQLLHQALGTRHMLIILDDVWTIEAALPFLIGSNAAHLLTTRLPEVAFAVPAGSVCPVPELDEQQSRLLVEQLVPHLSTCSEVLVEQVLHACGGLPLALTLVGRGVRLSSAGGQRRRLEAALEHFIQPESRLRLKLPHPPLTHDARSLEEVGVPWSLSLEAVIRQSERRLSSEVQEALRALSVLPTKPICFSETAALAVSGQGVHALDSLLDAGLLERADDGWYWLHQAIGEYAGLQQQDTEPLHRLVQYGVQVCASFNEKLTHEFQRLDAEYPVLLAAIQAAKVLREDQNLTQMVLSLVPFWCSRGLCSQAATLLQEALTVTPIDNEMRVQVLAERAHVSVLCEAWEQAQQDALSALVLSEGEKQQGIRAACFEWLGLTTQLTGKLGEARTYYEEGLQLARTCGDRGRSSRLLTHLGNLECDQGQYQNAATLLQEALALAQQDQNLEQVSLILANIGNTLQSQGKHQQAEPILRQGLLLARLLQHRPRQILLLGNLAASILEQGDTVQAEKLLLEGLSLTDQVHEKRLRRLCLLNLGCILLERQEYEQAEAYVREGFAKGDTPELPVRIMFLTTLGEIQTAQGLWQEAQKTLEECLKLAHDLDDPWLLSNGLRCYAEMYLQAQQIEKAERWFQEALAVYHDLEPNLELQAEQHFGLAQVAALQGRLEEAHRLAEQSFHTFLDIHHRSAAKVRTWIDQLPPLVVEKEEKEEGIASQQEMNGHLPEQAAIRCPTCSAALIYKRGKGASGRQRYLCRVCSRAFTAPPSSFQQERQVLARQLVAQGHSLRAVARQLGVSHTTVKAWVTLTT